MIDKAPELVALALKNTNNQLGYDAVHVLAAFKQLQLLDQAYDAAENKGPIISLIGNSRDEKAAKLLMPRVLDIKNDRALRRQMMEALKHTSTGSRGIMPIIIKGAFPKDLEDEALHMLAGCVYANVVDWAVGELAARNGGKEPISLNKLLAMQGHAEAGATVFDTYCMVCHKMDQRGLDFGPNLTTIGSKLGRFAMYDAILNPAAGVEFNYETTEVTLKDGSVLMGLTETESNTDVTLKLMGGQTKVSPRDPIKRLKRLPGSLMPAGIARGLQPQQLADLVEYLGRKK
jgi:putative heme-binding domain-containing protein